MSAETYTREYFRNQVAELTQRWGEKKFWKNPDAASIAAQAISRVYLHTEDGEKDADVYAFAIRELAMRESYMAILEAKR